ncbi:hypothetical protein DM01DRAFT_1332609 [Hesseltinella vesiculosa]|uniref:Mis12-domain-containing protein n=1 Tax=Hesseltinella vesiculosa TaxID=101127 RepID=A0A1X2GSK1_9FUNG|nr:hypothetical protein DM01DRAFT_1332609 [Hesseltinella vesiculosa]
MASRSNPSSSTSDSESHTRVYEQTELVAEHLGFLPIDFLDDFYNVTNIALYKSLSLLRDYLDEHTNNKQKASLEKAFPRLEKHMEKAIDKQFSLFTQYFLDHIIHLPENKAITLEHYKGLDLTISDSHLELLDQELELARNQVLSQKAFQHKLLQEKDRLEQLLNEIQLHKDALQLDDIEKESDIQLNPDTLQQAMENTEKVEETVRSLESQLPLRLRDHKDDRYAYLSEVVQRQYLKNKKS